MTEDIYKKPEANLLQETDEVKRPIAITIICVTGFVGVLASVATIFSDMAKTVGAWYPMYQALASLIALGCFIGMWKMKKAAVYTYIAFVGATQLVMLNTNTWQIVMLLIPGVVIVVTLYYSKSMK